MVIEVPRRLKQEIMLNPPRETPGNVHPICTAQRHAVNRSLSIDEVSQRLRHKIHGSTGAGSRPRVGITDLRFPRGSPSLAP